MFEVNSNGVIQFDAEDWKDQLLSDVYEPAFGGGLNIEPTSPIGVMLNADTALGTKIQAAIADVSNCYNPFSATGENLTKIGNSYGYIRRQNAPAHATVIFKTSGSLTILPGSTLIDDDGNTWTLNGFGVNNNPVEVTCNVTGTKCPANFIKTLGDIETTGTGSITSVNNPTAGVDGYEEESDEEMSKRMVTTGYAGRGRGCLMSIAAAISNVPGVYGISCQENTSASEKTIRGRKMDPHSIYFCVAGGSDGDIAEAIAKTKPTGCSTTGSIEIHFTDPENTDYVFTYQIERPRFQMIQVRLISKKGVNLSGSLDLFKRALSESQQLNAFPMGGEISAVNVIDRIPQKLTDLGIVGCDLSTDGMFWVKSITSNIDTILQIPEANVTIIQET